MTKLWDAAEVFETKKERYAYFQDNVKYWYYQLPTIDNKLTNIPIKPFLREDYNEWVKLINTATIPYYNSALYDIIKEEVAAYFNGVQSAERTASIIKSRVDIYLAEHY